MLKTVSSITNAIGALNYKGTWNASTNSPALASGVGTKGDYYVVSVAGSTNLDGETLWGVGDWAVFNGSVWQKVEGGNTINATTVSASTSVTTPVIQATSSAGGTLKNNSGTAQLQWGSGGGSNLSLEVATNINPANAAVAISPTGTGTVTINPATASTMNNVAIGGTTPLAITGTTITATGLTASSAVATNGSKQLVSVTNTGSGNNVLWSQPTLRYQTGNESGQYTLLTLEAQTPGTAGQDFGGRVLFNNFNGTTSSSNAAILGLVDAGQANYGQLLLQTANAGTLSTRLSISYTGAVTIAGSLSKGSGSFRIDHPIKPDTHQLVHSFIEGPQADLIYRGKVNLIKGKATVNIDESATMSEGTFVALCRDVQCFTTNESDWTAVRGSVTGNILTIESQDNTSTSSISWMVIGERQDAHMMDTEWTDENGKVIVEPIKEIKNDNPST
jgi:hypothetical protein